MANNLLGYAQQFIGQVIQNNMQNNMLNAPWRDAAIQAIQSGDQQTGQQLAANIMQSCGFSSPQEAIQVGLQNIASRGK